MTVVVQLKYLLDFFVNFSYCKWPLQFCQDSHRCGCRNCVPGLSHCGHWHWRLQLYWSMWVLLQIC